MKFPFNFSLELTDFIYEKIDRKLLRDICFHVPERNSLIGLNQYRLEKYWKKIQPKQIILNGDIYGLRYSVFYLHNVDICKAFILACGYNQMEIVDFLLSICGNICAEKNSDAIHMACYNGHLDIIKHLVKIYGVSAFGTCKFTDALFIACEYGHLEIVKYLISLGADIKIENNKSVILACIKGHLETVKYLVSLGADITAQDNAAVQIACEFGHLETVKYLVEKGADITANNHEAMLLADINDHFQVMEYLISLGEKYPTGEELSQFYENNPNYNHYRFEYFR